MFDIVRNNKRLVQGFLALITLPFAFWGIDAYVRGGGGGDAVATVGEARITQAQLQEAIQERKGDLQRRLGARFDPGMLGHPAFRQSVLDELVLQSLLMQEAARHHLVVGDAVVRDLVASIPGFQEAGQFSPSRYESALAAQGMSPAGFEAQIRRDLTLQQLMGALGDTSFVPDRVLDQVLSLQTEVRQVQALSFQNDKYLSKATVDDASIQAYYREHAAEFSVPEQVRLEYLTLSPEALRKQVSISESELRASYEANKVRYREAEQRRASHILLTLDPKASAQEKEKVKAKAEALLATLKAKPSEFSSLAKAQSQDTGSARQGGDLGFFARGAMVKPFEEAVWSLREGEISGLVASDFGFHIIQLTGIRGGRDVPFERVRGTLETELLQQVMSRKFAEATDVFGNLVYEQSDTLQPAAEKFHLSPKTSGWLTRQTLVGGLSSGNLLNAEKLVSAVFSEDAIQHHRNTAAIEIGKDTLISVRVIEHKAATTYPLETVRSKIEENLKQRAAAALAKSSAEAALVDIQKGGAVAGSWSSPVEVSRMNPRSLQPAALVPIFRLPADQLPGHALVNLPGHGSIIYKVLKVSPGDQSASERATLRESLKVQLSGVWAQGEVKSYLQALRDRYKVEINQTALQQDSAAR